MYALCPRKQGFTLIELLVVISIIALLIAILLPALAAARLAGNVSVCGNNHRQIMLSLTNYAMDSKGWLPGVRTQHSRPVFVRWDNNQIDLQSSMGHLIKFDYIIGPIRQVNANEIDGTPNKIFFCPTRQDFMVVNNTGGFAGIQVSYFRYSIREITKMFEPFGLATGKTIKGDNIYEFTANRALILDSVYHPTRVGQPLPTHDGESMNIGYGDGHAENRRLGKAQMIYRDNTGGVFGLESFIVKTANKD